MAYVSDSNLTQFWGLAKDYINAENGRFANWQQTEKAGAVTCWPVGGTPLLPTVDFLFSETGPASGDKGPENPSTITGVSEVKVTRANSNLIRWPYYDPSGRESNGITWTVNADGSISASGTSTASSIFRLQLTDNFPTQAMLIPRGTYHFSGCPSGGGGNTYRFDVAIYTPHAGTRATKTADYGSGGTLVVTEPALCSFYCFVNSGQTLSDLQFKPKLQPDGVDEPFERNEQDVYTIPLGSTYYGGGIDLATGLMTVTKNMEQVSAFGSVNNVGSDVVRFRFVSQNDYVAGNTSENFTSNCFVLNSVDGEYQSCRAVGGAGTLTNSFNFTLLKSSLDVSGAVDPSSPTNAEWLAAGNAWLSSNSTYFVCTLWTPTTLQLTPAQILSLSQPDKYTPRLNTVYTDAQAVQVGYVKSPIRSEYELTQAIIATEGGE